MDNVTKTCIFCRIARKDIPAELVYENDDVIAFDDLNKVAPTHVLIIPKKHIASCQDVESDDASLLGQLFIAARHVAEQKQIEKTGYRLVVNAGSGAGQSVFHLHLHVIGGRGFSWPPG